MVRRRRLISDPSAAKCAKFNVGQVIEGSIRVEFGVFDVHTVFRQQEGDGGEPAFRHGQYPAVQAARFSAGEISLNAPEDCVTDLSRTNKMSCRLHQGFESAVCREARQAQVLFSEIRRKVPGNEECLQTRVEGNPNGQPPRGERKWPQRPWSLRRRRQTEALDATGSGQPSMPRSVRRRCCASLRVNATMVSVGLAKPNEGNTEDPATYRFATS